MRDLGYRLSIPMNLVLGLVLVLLFNPGTASAENTIRVPADFSTIQAGINASSTGDTVLVSPGVYMENIVFNGREICLVSEAGPDTTSIDGRLLSPTVRFVNLEGASSVIEGFTIRNGTGTPVGDNLLAGGGIYVGPNASPTIRGNVITQNVSPTAHGGGLACFGSQANIIGNTFTDNMGGAIYITNATSLITITDNLIESNPGAEALSVVGGTDAIVSRNTVIGNGEDGIDLGTMISAIVTDNFVSMNGMDATFGQDGIRLQTIESAEVMRNTVTNEAGDGIYLRRVDMSLVSDNYVENCEDNGIYIWFADFAVSERNISGNNGQRGGYYRDLLSVVCRNNVSVQNDDDGFAFRSSTAIVDGVTSVGNGERGLSSLSSIELLVTNSIFHGNDADEIAQSLGGAAPVVGQCNVEGGYAGIGNIDAVPQFVNEFGADNNPTTVSDNDYRLLPGSPCIDAGDSTNWMCTDIDLARSPRLLDGHLDGNAVVDMGAYEYNNIALEIDDSVSGFGMVDVMTTGTPGMDVTILIGLVPAEDCTNMGPVFVDAATATSFGPFTSPVNTRLALPQSDGIGEYIIQAIAVDDAVAQIGNTSNAVLLPVQEFPVVVNADSVVVTVGVLASGDVSNLEESDNVDLSVNRNPIATQAVTEVEVSATTTTLNPGILDFTIEASLFARAQVTQSVLLYNFATGAFEEVDSRDGSRFIDASITVSPTGDLSRFVDQSTGEVRARVRFQGSNQRMNFAANIDQLIWFIGS